MNTTRIFLIIFFYWSAFTRTSAQSTSFDSLRVALESHKLKDSTTVNLLNELSRQSEGTNFSHGHVYAEQALQISKQVSFQKGFAVANNRLAYCYWLKADIDLAIEKALVGATIAEREGWPDVLAESYWILSGAYIYHNEIEKAEVYAGKAERLCLQTKNLALLSRVYNRAGKIQICKPIKNYDSALKLHNKSLVLSKQLKNDYYVPMTLTSIGSIYEAMRKDNDPFGKNNISGIKFMRDAVELARKNQNRVAEAIALGDLGSALITRRKFDEAEESLLESIRLSKSLGLKVNQKQNYLRLISLNMKQGAFSKAHVHLQDYYQMKDSIQNEKKTRQILELETRYEAEKKEQAIKLLEQEKKIQAFWNNGLIAGSAFLIIVFFIIYRLQQLRSQKAKELLHTQQQLNIKLKETDELKSTFFANVSHEFRTPLSLIIAPIEEKIRRGQLPRKDIEDLRLVHRNSQRLLELVNQLLDLSKIEAGKMILQLQRGNPESLIQILAASFESMAESRKIQFNKHISIDVLDGWFDADKLEKIIGNLLANAFKFTPSGGSVELTIKTFLSTGHLEIKISDTGVGISEEDFPHIFSPFYQSRNNYEDGVRGTGLGLALVNELVKLHQGKLDLVSKRNIGTSITVSIPLSKDKLPATAEVVAFQEPTLKMQEELFSARGATMNDELAHEINRDSILIVEDNADLRNFIGSYFKTKFSILSASDGEQGFALATEKIPTVIISDVMMPTMNGIVLAEKLKADIRSSHIPIILLTAKTDLESRIEGLSVGVDDYLAKPFSAEELDARVTNLISQRRILAEKYSKGLVSTVHPPVTKEASLDDKFMARAQAVVEKTMSDPFFGVEKFADEMHLSRAQLFRKIKALRGVSPTEFINNIRLQKAAELIRAKADTLTQIGYSVGFNEQSYFAKRFRKKFGVTPSQYSNSSS